MNKEKPKIITAKELNEKDLEILENPNEYYQTEKWFSSVKILKHAIKQNAAKIDLYDEARDILQKHSIKINELQKMCNDYGPIACRGCYNRRFDDNLTRKDIKTLIKSKILYLAKEETNEI